MIGFSQASKANRRKLSRVENDRKSTEILSKLNSLLTRTQVAAPCNYTGRLWDALPKAIPDDHLKAFATLLTKISNHRQDLLKTLHTKQLHAAK